MEKPVGLLWDSVSNNIGDQAIGLVMKRFLETRNINYQVVNPFLYSPVDYSTVIVGGGELIRALGDPFYDQYRVPGRHILNSVGTHLPTDLEYLNAYKLVSVRSEADRAAMSQFIAPDKVHVVPCTTILMKELFPELLSLTPQKYAESVVGIHVNAAAIMNLAGLINALQEINKKYKIVLFPFTLYQNDLSLLESIQSYLINSEIFPSTDPLQVFNGIGSMNLMISTSLHAAIFAYVNGIPFLSNPVYPKINHFLLERGLSQLIFNSAENLPYAVDEMLTTPFDYTQQLLGDKETIKQHLVNLEHSLKTKPDDELQPGSKFAVKKVDHNPAEIHHTLSMLNIKTSTELVAMELRFRKSEEEVLFYSQSKSWQITRPFRKIIQFLKGMKHALHI